MKISKKVIACLLILSMTLSMMPVMAFASEPAATSDAQENTVAAATVDNPLGATISFKGATYFDDPPWESNPTQTMIGHHDVKVPYNGWQLMQLDIVIPHQEGLEVKAIQPKVPSMYPEYSQVEKNDKDGIWTYTYFFEQNGTYDFTVDYVLNGKEKTMPLSYTMEGLVPIKDIRMRRHLVNEYYQFTNLGDSPQNGWYVTKDILGKTLYDPWGHIVYDFGKDGDNGRTAQYTRSLDGLQYASNIHGLYLFNCSNLEQGETIEPITHTVYPNMSILRISEIDAKDTNLPDHAYTPEMLAQAIGNMPNLGELSLSGTGFKDFPVIGQLNGNLWHIVCNYNEVESLEGIQKHPGIVSLGVARNKITSVEPLGKVTFDDLGFLDMGGNGIFDLSPMKDTVPQSIVAGQSFSARAQSIPYRKTVISTLQGDAYRIELPMPIDIDGTLTDVNNGQVTAYHQDGTQKIYPSFKKDGKSYIDVPKADVDTNKENPFDNTIFQFVFLNNNGKDARTKNWFSGTLAFKASPYTDEYRALYDFESGTRGKALPPEVTDLLPVDATIYSEGDTIKAIQPEKNTVPVDDGVWIFQGYDADSKVADEKSADEDKNVTFVGKWTFEKTPEATVTFKIENGSWSDKSHKDKLVEIELIDGKGTLDSGRVPKGMQADEGYENGHWVVEPNTDENGITGDVTYTYVFDKKAEATVTFKIENGNWVDGTTDDKHVQVVLTAGKGGTLEADKVPTGMKAAEGYEGGAWDVVPNTAENGITGNVTYTYRFIKKAQATVTFKVENGTWADGSRDDKTVNVVLSNGKGTLETNQVPTGMKAAEGYEGGQWDVVPNTAVNGITGNVTYTYRFTKQSGGSGGGGAVTTKYTLTYESNGGTEYDSERYRANKVVSLDKVPTRERYQFTGWYADKALTQKIDSIKMTSDKTVYAGWKRSGDGYIPEDLNSKDHVAYVSGYEDGTVKPDNSITRAETASMLYRLLTDERRDEITTLTHPFGDMTADDWYAQAVASMANGGYIAGYEDGTFGGNNRITRAEFVAMLVRFIGPEAADCTFSDVPKSHWAYSNIATATNAGWISGYPDGTFGPNRNISRAEAMSIINRVLDRGVDANSTLLDFKQWPDNPKNAWYYYEVIEATNEHEYTGSRPSEDWTSLEIG